MQMAHPFMEAIAVFQKIAEEARIKWKARPDRLTFQAIAERDEVLVQCQYAIDILHDAYKEGEAEHNSVVLLSKLMAKPKSDPWNNNPYAH